MHCLLIHQAFATPAEPGGTRHFELATLLGERGHRFTVVTARISYLTGREVRPQQGDETYGPIRVRRVRMLGRLHTSFAWRVVSFVTFMLAATWAGLRVRDVDIVLGTTPPLFQAAAAWLVARLKCRPFILEVRDLWPEFAIDMGVLRNPFLIRLARWLERFLYRRADGFIVNSPAYRDYLVAKGIAPERISFVPNGVDTSMFDPRARGAAYRARHGLAADDVVVSYTGALGMANDIETILAAAEQLADLPRIRFVLVGDGKERAHLERDAVERGLANVLFTGASPKEEMPQVLAASDVCVATLMDIPMFRTTYPNKVFDYLAAGRPVVLGIDGVIRAVVEDAGAGICVEPGDPAALAAAVRRLAANPGERARLGAAGRAHVEKHFERRELAERFAAALEGAAGLRAGRRPPSAKRSRFRKGA